MAKGLGERSLQSNGSTFVYDNQCFDEDHVPTSKGEQTTDGGVEMAIVAKADDSLQGRQLDGKGVDSYYKDVVSPAHECKAVDVENVERSRITGISKAKYGLVFAILVTEMAERLAFYSVSANMVLFCTSRLGFTSVQGTTISLVFSALSNLFPVLGGYVADARVGRFTTIWTSFSVNLIGFLAIQCSAVDFHSWFGAGLDQTSQRSLYLLGALLIALGTGGVKANISPFGAEQLAMCGGHAVESFFHWFYWGVNVGALLAYSGVAYLQQNVDFTWGLFIPLATTFLTILVFVTPRKRYIRSSPNGSPLTTAFRVIRQGLCHAKTRQAGPPSATSIASSPKAKIKGMFSRAKEQHGGDFNDVTVNGVAGVVSVLPFCGLVIMYYAIYSQTTSSFFVQSEHMDIRLGQTKIPAAMLNTTGNVIILLLVPIIDRIFYPCMRKIGIPLTHLKRIGIGMVLSAVAVIVAGIVETHRKDVMEQGGTHIQVLANENFTASSVSVFMQVPQFALIGASEIFTSVTCLEFAYTQAPHSFQGLLTGLFLAAWGLGNGLSVGIMLMVEKATESDPWYGSDINEVKVENYNFLLAGLMGANLIVFSIVAWRFKYRNGQGKPEAELSSTPHVVLKPDQPSLNGLDTVIIEKDPSMERSRVEMAKSVKEQVYSISPEHGNL